MKFTTSIALLTAVTITVLSGPTASAQQEHFDHSHDSHQPSHGSLHTASGMLLGVYAQTTQGGLTITDTIPGYSAAGRLFAGDILLQATAAGMPTFSIRSHQDMENAKSQIGPFREAAIEFFRPGVGNQYAWVTFKPIGGGVDPHGHDEGHPHVFNEQAPPPQGGQPFVQGAGPLSSGGFPSNPNNQTPFSSNTPSNPNNFQPKAGNPNNFSPHSDFKPSSPNNTTMRSRIPSGGTGKFQAEFRLESEKPGARLLFKNPGGIQLGTPPQTSFPQSGNPQSTPPQPQESTQPRTRSFQFRGRSR